jgi:hypothetical protein
MKLSIFLLISIFFYNHSIGQELIIKIKVDTCINPNAVNKVEFLIENKNNFECVVKTEFLPFYFGIYSLTGEMVERKSTRHLNAIGNKEYIIIGKNSSESISWSADFWDNFEFNQNQEYYIATTYEYSYLTRNEKKKFKKSDIKLVKSKNKGQSNNFRICKL